MTTAISPTPTCCRSSSRSSGSRRSGVAPELPDAKKARFMRDFGLSSYDAGTLVAEQEWADYFEKVRTAEEVVDPKLAANWVLNEVRAPTIGKGWIWQSCRRAQPRATRLFT